MGASKYIKDNGLTAEDAIGDVVDNLCSVKKKEGRWVSKFDIEHVDGDGSLALKEQSTPGVCRTECATIQRACSVSLKGDLAGMLLKSKGEEEIRDKLCRKACKRKLPKLASWADEAFEARDAKDIELEDMGMKIYKRGDGSLSSLSHGARMAAAAAGG